MLKEKKLKHDYVLGGNSYGYCKIEGFDGYIYGEIQDENIINEISGEDYYFAEVRTSASDSDYHTFCYEYEFKGVFLNFDLKTDSSVSNSVEALKREISSKAGIINIIEELLKERNMVRNGDEHDVDIKFGCLKVTLPNRKLDNVVLDLCKDILQAINDYYSKCEEEQASTLNRDKSLTLIKKREVHNYGDCPHSCV